MLFLHLIPELYLRALCPFLQDFLLLLKFLLLQLFLKPQISLERFFPLVGFIVRVDPIDETIAQLLSLFQL